LGPPSPCAVLGESSVLKKAWPGVVEAAKLIGSKQVQGRCTIQGNLCNASPAADSVPALVAAGAKAVVAGPSGKRIIPVEAVADRPGKTVARQGRDHRGDPARQARAAFGRCLLRFIPRTEMGHRGGQRRGEPDARRAWRHNSRRVALGAAAPTVLLVEEAAEALIGRKLDEAALERLAKVCAGACRPIDDKRGTIEFRRKVAGVLARRAATTAYARAGGK